MIMIRCELLGVVPARRGVRRYCCSGTNLLDVSHVQDRKKLENITRGYSDRCSYASPQVRPKKYVRKSWYEKDRTKKLVWFLSIYHVSKTRVLETIFRTLDFPKRIFFVKMLSFFRMLGCRKITFQNYLALSRIDERFVSLSVVDDLPTYPSTIYSQSCQAITLLWCNGTCQKS